MRTNRCQARTAWFLIANTIGIIALGMASASRTIADSSIPPSLRTSANPDFTLACSLPEAIEKMPVFRVVDPEIDGSWVEKYAEEHFGIEGEVNKDDGAAWIVRAGERKLEVILRNNSIWYTNGEIKTKGGESSIKGASPGRLEYRRIAEKFLNERKLMENDAGFYGVADGSVINVMSVYFTRTLSGVPVVGAGARMIVYVGRSGVVSKVFKAWQHLVRIDEKQLIAPDQAFAKLSIGSGDFCEGRTGVISSVRVVYRSSPIKQEYLQPYYLFECHARNDDEDTFEVYVPALEEPYPEAENAFGC